MDTDHERISRKAHEIWESEGHPHGRDQVHWDQAKEIIAIEDSMDDTLLPRATGAEEIEEAALTVANQGDVPNLTDQGADDLTSRDREPPVTRPAGTGSDAPERPARETAASAAASRNGEASSGAITGRPAAKEAGGQASVTQGKGNGRN